MTIDQQVCSFEHAKRLRDLGVKQDSYFTYACLDGKLTEIWTQEKMKFLPSWALERKARVPADYISAFSVAELGEMLGIWLTRTYYDHFNEDGIHFYVEGSDGKKIYVEDAPTEADARAQLLIYLIEIGLCPIL